MKIYIFINHVMRRFLWKYLLEKPSLSHSCTHKINNISWISLNLGANPPIWVKAKKGTYYSYPEIISKVIAYCDSPRSISVVRRNIPINLERVNSDIQNRPETDTPSSTSTICRHSGSPLIKRNHLTTQSENKYSDGRILVLTKHRPMSIRT